MKFTSRWLFPVAALAVAACSDSTTTLNGPEAADRRSSNLVASSTNSFVLRPSTLTATGLANVASVSDDAAPGFGTGSIRGAVTVSGQKSEMYFTAAYLFNREVALGEIASISYWTNKGTTHAVSAADWYLALYTKPFAGDVSSATWYGGRFGSEPYFAKDIAAPANNWNNWTTGGATNQLRFFESTAGATGANFGTYTDADWSTFKGQDHLGTAVSRGSQELLYFVVGTGSAWANGFTGKVDGIRVVLTDGSTATIDLEANGPACTTTCFVSTTGNDANGGASAEDAKKTIAAAITAVTAGGTVTVAAGTYTQNLTIAKSLTLQSSGGRAVTTIQGVANGNTIGLSGTTTGVVIGGAGAGFTVNGTDNAAAGVETAAILLAGSHTNLTIADNNIVAGGEAGVLLNTGTMAGLVIDGNELSGKTFVGEQPAGNGFTNQFTLHNVPRQLVAINPGGVGSSITFRNNIVSGVAGGIAPEGNQQGNTLVTIDFPNASISGNSFTGFTNRFGASLRIGGLNAVVRNNKFAAASPTGLYARTAAVGATVSNNSFVGNTREVDSQAATLNAAQNFFGTAAGPVSGDLVNATAATWIGSYTDDPAKAGKPGFWPINIGTGAPAGTPAEAVEDVPQTFIGTGGASIGITIDDIATPGTVTVTSVTTFGGENPAPAGAFALGTSTLYYDIDFAGSITPGTSVTVCLSYPAGAFGSNEPALFHYELGEWKNITTSVDPDARIVCGSATSFSPFALGVDLSTAAFTVNGGNPVQVNTAVAINGTVPSGFKVQYRIENGTFLDAPMPNFTATGVYTVCLRLTDDTTDGNETCVEVPVYDPAAGFVTGGGWFISPATAFKAAESLTGKANFGFVSKYEKGATVPTGNTSFQFSAGKLSFSSTSYEWLVVNRNDTNAQYKGVGTVTVNGVATTGADFMLWAQDGKNGNPDTFRIKITAPGGGLIYDNLVSGEFGTRLGGGNIIVHTK